MVTTKPIERDVWKQYYSKAKEFSVSMQEDYMGRRWNSCGLMAVHCAISISDAVLAYKAGIRNTSADHHDAAKLLKTLVKDNDIATQEKHFSRIIDKKNLIAYEGREIDESVATDLVKHAERFLSWAEKVLPLGR